MIALREATRADATAVLADLSVITATDLGKREYPPLVLEGILDHLFENGVVYSMVDGDEILCVTGLSMQRGELLCWLLAREPFWTVRPSIWRILRRYSQNVLAGLNEEVHSYSGSEHPALARWMGALGFEEAEPVAGFRHFIYPAPRGIRDVLGAEPELAPPLPMTA